ncbi:RNA polymerase sigma factor SigD [Stieleria maiorica]|uniref:RNA polymerase sigma factor SigD n=1 Tax=Stieleria maiorica TaxID=2795974 RepID=A0A5B9MI20_9BACT|nr:sigma-70 family RNA polymerase sigma factor [Stieleria maiorica]QEG00779.1 RNA polymerase sigma factor SigD [Stieleria maiorica]
MSGPTSVSLLQRLRDSADEAAWQRFCDLYSPIIRGWLIRRGLNQNDADDVQQSVMEKLAEKLPAFEHNGNTGAFRLWLKNVVANRLTVAWREKQRLGQGAGSEQVGEMAKQLADPNSQLSQLWDQEYQQRLCERLLSLAEPDFSPQTMSAFRMVFLENRKAKEVGEELGLTANAVRIAQSRVLSRLRELGEGLLDD